MVNSRSRTLVYVPAIPLVLAGFALAAVPGDTAAPKDRRELHVVSIYEGVYKTEGKIHGGRAFVKVKRPGKLVTLCFYSYNPVTWEVTLDPDTKLEKVILGGYHRQEVKGLPRNVEVVEAFRKGKAPQYLSIGNNLDRVEFRNGVRQLNKMTGMEIASFHGTNAYRHEEPIIIDKVQDDPRLSADYPKPSLPKDLPKLEFKAIHYSIDKQFRHGLLPCAYGDFSLRGPDVNSLKPLPRDVARLAYDPAAKKYYGIARHGVVEVDLAKQKTTEMELGLDVPPLSWPNDITFDTKRHRLLLTNSSGGYLYAYETKTGKWSVLAEKLGVDAFTYHPKDDAIYGLEVGLGENGVPILRHFNPEGALLKKTPLGPPVHIWCLSHGPGVCRTQLIPVDRFLVILGSPDWHRSGRQEEGLQTFLFVVDPKTGKGWLARKE